MSYMPAEEADEDYDSEDGFCDIDDTLRKKANNGFGGAGVMTQHHSGHGDQRNLHPKTTSWTTSSTDHVSQSHQRRFPSINTSSWPRGTIALTVEDLKMAALKGHAELVERCLGQGIQIDEPLRSGWTALMYAANNAQPEIVQLLLEKGASTKYQCDMYTPLMSACSGSSIHEEKVGECVRLLVEAGANVNAKDRYHATPLMLASREGHVSAVRELIQHGADVNMQDSHGWTALTCATQRSRKAVVVELLDGGADPSIQHLDKLTVKDLAANLPTDEMLALLERRPANLIGPAGETVQFTPKKAEMETSHDLGDPQVKLTDLRYGELEVFLHGLELPHLIGLFQQQLIDLDLLMTLTEQDLINAGVKQVGARKKLLDAVQAVHKKDWQPSSLVSIHFNKQIRCADAVAMLANSSKHLRYIGSTVVYIREQLKKHPETITQPTDSVTPNQFMRHAGDAMQNVFALENQLHLLQTELKKEMRKRNSDPADVIHFQDENKKKKSNFVRFLSGTIAICSGVLVLCWYKKDYVSSLINASILHISPKNS